MPIGRHRRRWSASWARQPSLDFPTSRQIEAQSAAQVSATNAASFAARPTTTKPVKMSIPTFDGKDSDSLVFWVREIEIALSAGQIYDARAQVAFALSNLGGRAHAWAMARETATPGYFTSWSFMEQELRSTFLLANVAYRHRSNFLRCKQGKRSLQDYVMELHNLEAATAGAPLSEDVTVTVFMDGVLGAGRPAGRIRSSVREVSSSPASQKEQVPGTTLLCLSVAADRSNLVVVTASVKGYPEPMTVLIDSGASFNFATKASVARNNALYASALEASKSNTNVSVRLATGSIVSTRKVTIPLNVKFDDFDSVEPFIVLDMDDRYDLILGMPWLAKHEPWIDWRSRTIGPSHNPLADRALVGHVPSSSRDGFVHEHRVPRDERQFVGSSEVLELPTVLPPRAREPEVGDGEKPQDPDTSPMGRQAPPTQSVAAGSAHVEEGAGVVTRANKSGRVGTPTTQGVVARSVRATEGAGACARATTGGRAGAPTSKAISGDKVTSTPKAEASGRDADFAAEDRAPQAIDVFTGEPKAGKLVEVVLLRPQGGSLELNSSSVMDSEVLEDERTSRRQTRYGAAILKDPSDPYYPLLKGFSGVVSDDPPSVLPPDRGVRHEIDLVPGTNANYAEMARPLANLPKKDAVWSWTSEAQQAFEAIKNSLQSAPSLALPDEDRPFSVVCDAPDFAIGCALLHVDAEGRERVVSFQSRQLKAAEKNYPVHDKELLAMKYALVKFRVHLLGQKPFVIYTDHASLRTATSSPHISQRMARWLSFFAEYNFTVEYKPESRMS
ncbi:unnamed protein product [Phytophthora fragariaefolia]|uniref:Unnamed protein product n=1 Tax=Phytophthora fragariaefolia TaxID=1490495 RepID=A0A9W6X8T3_9STRA|nr:unnamed protein product [Phytophthora fragariaefolia]